MSRRKKNTTSYINVHKDDVHSVGSMLTPLKKGTFVKDPTQLFYQYKNLIHKLGHKFSKDFSNVEDYKDLFAYIQEAFTELAIEYNRYSGVNFPGYIVKKLNLRIKYSYVSKQFVQKKRSVLLRSGDYGIRDLLNVIQSHGEGQITTDKENRVSRVRGASHIDFSFRERINDIEAHIDMDQLDQIIFAFLIDGFSRYGIMRKLVHRFDRHYHLHHTNPDIHEHLKYMKKALRNYYLQAPDTPVLMKKSKLLMNGKKKPQKEND